MIVVIILGMHSVTSTPTLLCIVYPISIMILSTRVHLLCIFKHMHLLYITTIHTQQ